MGAPIIHSKFLSKRPIIRQYECVVLTIIYYKIFATLNNTINKEVPLRKKQNAHSIEVDAFYEPSFSDFAIFFMLEISFAFFLQS